MSLALYMDVHVRRAVTSGLRLRGVDVLTAQEDGTARWPDDQLLDRAGALKRVLFSQDDDLLIEAERRQRENHYFAGVIYAHQLAITVGHVSMILRFLQKLVFPKISKIE